MLIYTVRRFVSSILVLLVTSFIAFMFTAASYDPLKRYRAQNPQPTKAFMQGKEHLYHLDQGVLARYWDWLVHLLRFHASFPPVSFNFGNDVNSAPVSSALAQRLEITTRLIFAAIVVALIISIVGGVVSGVRRGKPIDVSVTFLTFLLLALPTFWFAALLKEMAIKSNRTLSTHLYTAFDETPGLSSYGTSSQILHDQLSHLILPTISLALLTAAGWIRYQRASTIEVLDADYMRLARAKGVRNRTVIRRHGLRNALIPLVTVAAIDAGALFGGAIITEKVYVWHGMGDYLNTALANEDTYAVVGWVMVSAIFVVLFNFLADLLYAAIDPRIRLA
ncbi:ABC transporter permease [Jatrophihabitans sp.]|uniref:ABC transporter permease n=1 Tax=Jatrophihabitans sp. TaxID=1932789 RepID=UPI0030C6FEE6|nr:putative peptide transport permease [Jatrophihabitans sp.]